MWKCREPSRGQPKGLENFQIINIEEELKPTKPKFVLILKTILKALIKAKIWVKGRTKRGITNQGFYLFNFLSLILG